MEVFVPSAKESCRFYDQSKFCGLDLKRKLEVSWSKVFSTACTHIFSLMVFMLTQTVFYFCVLLLEILKAFYLYVQFDASLSKLQGSDLNCYKDMDDKHKTLRKQLSDYHAKILYCLDELGLICAYEVWLYSL